MNLRLAWRNIWRSKKRTLVVMTSIAMGIWAIIFTVSFANGIYISMINSSILSQYSHIQIHHPEYRKDKEIRFKMDNGKAIIKDLENLNEGLAVTGRLKAEGMISSSKGAQGISITGIDPQRESGVTKLDERIIEGNYFDGKIRHPILIGEKLAENLNLKLKSKIVLTFQDVNGDITASAFRVSGIFRMVNSTFEEAVVFVRMEDLAQHLEISTGIHEIAIFSGNPEGVVQMNDRIKSDYPDLDIQTWRELAPELNLMESTSNLNLYIISIIIMAALIFGIINTMLMAVLERIRELGMLMAIGLNKTRVFLMIVYETILLSLVGGPVGLLLGYITVQLTAKNGIDLSFYSASLRKFGMNEMIRPVMEQDQYGQLALMVMMTALLASIYPAIKAIRLNPVEALRKL